MKNQARGALLLAAVITLFRCSHMFVLDPSCGPYEGDIRVGLGYSISADMYLPIQI